MDQRNTFMKTREELKKDKARDEWEKFIAQGWRITEGGWTKKKAKAANP